MKLLDKKGRLFGIINIMDLLIILVIITIGFVAYTKFIKKPDNAPVAQSNKKQITIVAEAYRQRPSIAASIKEGDTLVAQNKYQTGKILSVSIRDNDYVASDAEGNLIAQKDKAEKTIEVEISCEANVSGPYMDSGGQMLKIGYPYWIKTAEGQIKGFIKEIRLEEE